MSDNPFLEPEGNERTIYERPAPGGVRSGGTAPVPRPSARTGDGPAATGEAFGRLATGHSPLIVAATPLLQLLGRLQNTINPPDPADLRARTMQAVRDFEIAGRAAGIPREILHPARYALCASIDDIVLHMRWGETSPWAQASLVSTFHQDVISGEEFFRKLDDLKKEPARNLMLLELMYYCLSLGYQGQYRVLGPRGPSQLAQIREDLYQTLVRFRPPYEQGLSPRWQGVEAPYRPARAVVPAWVMAVAAIAAIAIAWGGLARQLGAASAEARRMADAIPPSRMPSLDRPAPRPDEKFAMKPADPLPQSETARKLLAFLPPEQVWETPQMVRVRIYNGGMFASGSATLKPDFHARLEQIGEALNGEEGGITVTGYTDDRPINTVQFPSNDRLSVARAEAARAVMARRVRDPGRLTAKGHGKYNPIADNDTEEGRALNRRIEITLERPETGG